MSDSQAITFRAARPEDHKTLLEINQEGQPGVATLDLAELRRLEALADYLKVLEVGGRVSGYLIGFLRGTEYDGEEFGSLSEVARQKAWTRPVAPTRRAPNSV